MFSKTFSRGCALLASVVACGLLAGPAHAAEISVLSGIYQSQSNKTSTGNTTTDEGTSSDISVGARYSQPIEGHLYWYAGGLLELKSYSKGDLPDAPSDSTSLTVNGGVRYYFNKLSDNIAPYGEAGASYRDAHSVDYPGGGTYTETEDNGLYYNAALGMRFNLSKDFFLDLQTNLFNSPLFATVKKDTTTYSGTTKTKTEDTQKSTDLYVNTVGLLSDATVGVGMRF